jgi:hypothetical protein
MTPQEAREILRRRRPGGADDTDADVAEALALARSEKTLGEWLEGHEKAEAALKRALREIRAPSGLGDSILAAERVRRRLQWRRRIMAAAAAVAVTAALVRAFTPGTSETYAGFRRQMIRQAVRDYRMDMISADLGGIRRYLAEHDGFADFELPGRLGTARLIGCALLRYHNQPVSLVCFDGKANGTLYLFIAARNSLAGGPPEQRPQVETLGRMTTASWASGDKTYLLAMEGGITSLEEWAPQPLR